MTRIATGQCVLLALLRLRGNAPPPGRLNIARLRPFSIHVPSFRKSVLAKHPGLPFLRSCSSHLFFSALDLSFPGAHISPSSRPRAGLARATATGALEGHGNYDSAGWRIPKRGWPGMGRVRRKHPGNGPRAANRTKVSWGLSLGPWKSPFAAFFSPLGLRAHESQWDQC